MIKEAEITVGKLPIFKKRSIKLSIIRIIGNLNDGEIVIEFWISEVLLIKLTK